MAPAARAHQSGVEAPHEGEDPDRPVRATDGDRRKNWVEKTRTDLARGLGCGPGRGPQPQGHDPIRNRSQALLESWPFMAGGCQRSTSRACSSVGVALGRARATARSCAGWPPPSNHLRGASWAPSDHRAAPDLG